MRLYAGECERTELDLLHQREVSGFRLESQAAASSIKVNSAGNGQQEWVSGELEGNLYGKQAKMLLPCGLLLLLLLCCLIIKK